MRRRAFLGLLAASFAGVALDPERALWVPGAKTIFLPAAKPVLTTSSVLTAGDVFVIGGVYALHPVTGYKTDHLQAFMVTADVRPGEISIASITPQPRDRGMYRNVDSIPVNMRATPLHVGRTIPTTFEWSEA